MIHVAPSSLTFPDRRQGGRFPVTDATGTTVARISTRWTGPPACITPHGSAPTDTAIIRAASGTSSSESGPAAPPGAPNWPPTSSTSPG
jgi:hypothetical protein